MQKFNLNISFNPSLILNTVECNKNALIKNIIELENKFDPKYKTELCQKYQNTGKCPYGYKCRFAHGKAELVTKHPKANYKKIECKSFYEKGYCPYGSRCNFKHFEKKFSDINLSYYYFRLFLLKINNNKFLSDNFLNLKGSKLINGRLSIFETIAPNFVLKEQNNNNNVYESSKDLFEIQLERNNSQSTVSNTSFEEDKKFDFLNEYSLKEI